MTSTQQEIKGLKQNIVQLKEMLEEQLEEATHKNGVTNGFSTEEVRQFATQAGEGMRAYLRTKGKQLSHAKQRSEEVIKKHPFAATATAVAGGALIASLLRRK